MKCELILLMLGKIISAALITASVISLSTLAAHACWICDPIGETKKTFKNPRKGFKNLGTGITDGLKKTRDAVGKGAVVIFSGAGKQMQSGGGMGGRDSTHIPLDTREGQLEIAEEDGEDTDSLVLPYQTTGSF